MGTTIVPFTATVHAPPTLFSRRALPTTDTRHAAMFIDRSGTHAYDGGTERAQTIRYRTSG